MTEIDWKEVRDTAVDLSDDPIGGVTYDVLADALAEKIDGLPGGYIEDSEAVKEKNGKYVFYPEKFGSETEEESFTWDSSKEEVNLLESIESTSVSYPPLMKEREQWVTCAEKIPRAPWENEHLYPVSYGGDLNPSERPIVSFQKAKKWIELSKQLNLDAPDEISASDLELGYLISHETERYSPNLTLIDLDDVRKPTGEIHPIAREVLKKAGSYAEISTSGEGIHIFVAGELSPRFAQLVVKIDDEPFVGDELPKIEIYDHSRVASLTGNHVDGTPETIAEGQDVIDWVIEEYTDEDDGKTPDELLEDRFDFNSEFESSNISPYFKANPAQLVSTTGKHWRQRGDSLRGPHPSHGSTNNDNFVIQDGAWFCFRHDHGGGPLSLIGIKEDFFDCEDASLDNLTDEEFGELCLIARDEYTLFEDNWKPPYRALVGVAKRHDFDLDENGELGSSRPLIESVYENIDASQM